MGRRFDVVYNDRAIEVCVNPVDEAWEFWLCERGKRLALGLHIPIDDVLLAWRRGDEDPFQSLFERIQERLLAGELFVPEVTDHAAP
jgi:hypothetical protein